jgi:hypothetical protein
MGFTSSKARLLCECSGIWSRLRRDLSVTRGLSGSNIQSLQIIGLYLENDVAKIEDRNRAIDLIVHLRLIPVLHRLTVEIYSISLRPWKSSTYLEPFYQYKTLEDRPRGGPWAIKKDRECNHFQRWEAVEACPLAGSFSVLGMIQAFRLLLYIPFPPPSHHASCDSRTLTQTRLEERRESLIGLTK